MGVDYLGIENIHYYNELFGFGSVSGIDLEGEVAGGLIRLRNGKEQIYNTPWTLGDTLNSSNRAGIYGRHPAPGSQHVRHDR